MKILEFCFCLWSFARQKSYDGGALVVVPNRRMKQSKRDPLGYSVESFCATVTMLLGKIQILTKTKWNYRFSPTCLTFFWFGKSFYITKAMKLKLQFFQPLMALGEAKHSRKKKQRRIILRVVWDFSCKIVFNT